jgi:hypothetical protein
MREPDGKRRTLTRLALNLDVAAVPSDDAVCNGQTKAGSNFPGGKKGFKNFIYRLVANPFAGITHFYAHKLIVRRKGR